MRAVVIVCLALSAAPAWAQEGRPAWAAPLADPVVSAESVPPPVTTPPVVKKAAPKPAGVGEPEPDRIRQVAATNTEPIRITTKLRYQTLLLLPEDDPIVDVLSGDAGIWEISQTPPATIHIKPTQQNFETNLNIVTTSGAVYSFLLREGRADGKPLALPDLRVTVTSNRPRSVPAGRKYYTVGEFEAVRADVVALRTLLDSERAKVGERIAEAKQRPPTAFHFDYTTPDGKPLPNVKPFMVKAIFHDTRFTYVRLDAKEKPAIYELKDGQPSVLDYQLQGDTYAIPKVIDRAYLIVGKARLDFAIKDGSGN